MSKNDFKELFAWQQAMDIAVEAYSIVRKLPDYERYSLSDQIRRCAISIPSNIVEGQARKSHKEFLHFLSISRGSIAELQTQLILCVKIGYASDCLINPVLFRLEELDKTICGLMRYLNERVKD